jgi:PAS domain S-box-containing protein
MDHAILRMAVPHEHARLLVYVRTRLPGEETSTPSKFQGVRKDGSLLWVAVVANMVNWEGTPAIQVAMMDITERKQAQEAMRQQWEWLTDTLASIGDGVITTDNRGAITFLNPVAEGLTGWSTSEVLGHPIDEVLRLIDASTRQPVDLQISHVMRQQCVVNVVRQAILLTRNGREVMLADSASPILSGHGELHGVVMVFRDISEQLQLEEEVLRARKIESVGILAGGIAHDLNNLLTGILGNISLAMTWLTSSDRMSQDKIVERLAEAEMACQRATVLTQQLLTFAKGGAPVRQTVAIADLLHEVTAFTLRGANVRADFAIAKDLWPVDADAGQMYQVVHNVVLNAVQSMPDGGVIQVQADNLNTPPTDLMLPLQQIPYVKIAIRDHGCGIEPGVLAEHF